MQVIVDLCVVPLGVGVSVSSYGAACQQVLEEAGLTFALHAYGTNIEGLTATPTLCVNNGNLNLQLTTTIQFLLRNFIRRTNYP